MYSLRSLEDKDIKLVKHWIEQDYVSKWFGDVSDWIEELEGRNDKYIFIKHFIVEDNNIPIGFVQYYDYNKLPIEESMELEPIGTYGIDYLIGNIDLLNKGLGKQLVKLICDKVIDENDDIIRIVADPIIEDEKINIASIKVLEANQFYYDKESNLYKKDIK